MLSRLILILKGFCMGAADVVPGVSGGTMALILGIYREFIAAIKSFDLEWFKAVVTLDFEKALTRPHFNFIIPLVIGIVGAIFFFTRIVGLPALILLYPELVYGFFFGLILASIAILLKQSQLNTISNLISLILGIVLGGLVFNLIPTNTPNDAWFIFLCGAIAISAMILPGISGSFILLMLKKYAYIFNAIGHLEWSVLIPFISGLAVGLIIFSRFLYFLLSRFYAATLQFIIGLLIASLWVIWPFQERIYATVRGKERLIDNYPVIPVWDTITFYSLLLILIGFVIVFCLEKLTKKHA